MRPGPVAHHEIIRIVQAFGAYWPEPDEARPTPEGMS
jgi:hypothetical protein